MRLRRPLLSSAAALIALSAMAGFNARAEDAQQNAAPTTNQNSQGDNAAHSTTGRAGAEEPGSSAPTQNDAVFVNGALNVPGAPADSQTVPAKFSKRNNAIDNLPIMAMPELAFTNEQKRSIINAVRGANTPVQSTNAKPAEELPIDVAVQDVPAAAGDPAFAKIKLVRAQDRILLVEPTNRVVIGEIEN